MIPFLWALFFGPLLWAPSLGPFFWAPWGPGRIGVDPWLAKGSPTMGFLGFPGGPSHGIHCEAPVSEPGFFGFFTITGFFIILN